MTILRVPVLIRDRHTFFYKTNQICFPQQHSEKRFDKGKDFFGRGAATKQTRQFAPSKLPKGEVDGDERNGGICADPLANCRRIFSPLYCLCVFPPVLPFSGGSV